MADRFERSTRYIVDFLKWLAPEATVKPLPDHAFRINFREEQTDVRFDRSEMEDFEIALEKFQNTAYFHTMENRIRFRFFIALGLKGPAVCAIMEKEKSRAGATLPRVRKAIDVEIYSIVSAIRDDPFRDIKLPEALHDYVLQRGEVAPTKTPAFVRQATPDPEQ